MVGLAGAALAGLGDVLILGRGVSGADFDRAAGVVPPHVEPVRRWRSLWNGAVLPRRRVHAGTLGGVVGIWLLGRGLRGACRGLGGDKLGSVALGSAAAFTWCGALTHLSCGAVVLAYQRAASGSAAPTRRRPAPTFATSVLALSAVGSLGALAVLSADLAVAALLGRSSQPLPWSVVTPFPFVLGTLLSFGHLPAPVGGYARPASISTGLALYFLVAAASRPRPCRTSPR